MTRQQIDEFMRTKTNIAINALVLRRVMGRTDDDVLFNPIVNMNDAMAVVEKIINSPFGIVLSSRSEYAKWQCRIYPPLPDYRVFIEYGDSLPRAICHAALLTTAED